MPSSEEFVKELEALINRFSIENKSNTPDWILAGFVDVVKKSEERLNAALWCASRLDHIDTITACNRWPWLEE
jgi:hypothetical protein